MEFKPKHMFLDFTWIQTDTETFKRLRYIFSLRHNIIFDDTFESAVDSMSQF